MGFEGDLSHKLKKKTEYKLWFLFLFFSQFFHFVSTYCSFKPSSSAPKHTQIIKETIIKIYSKYIEEAEHSWFLQAPNEGTNLCYLFIYYTLHLLLSIILLFIHYCLQLKFTFSNQICGHKIMEK